MYRWVRGSHKLSLRSRGFMEAPWAGGVVLLACVVIAMLLANLPMTKEYYHNFLETDLSLVVHSPNGLIDWAFPQGMTVEKFINDCLMVSSAQWPTGSFHRCARRSCRWWPRQAACCARP